MIMSRIEKLREQSHNNKQSALERMKGFKDRINALSDEVQQLGTASV